MYIAIRKNPTITSCYRSHQVVGFESGAELKKYLKQYPNAFVATPEVALKYSDVAIGMQFIGNILCRSTKTNSYSLRKAMKIDNINAV